ncbi:hypothetical protein [Streptomyces sp. NPDC002564]|uniref:hypothetical protein n=1 Tax=Streptomyces sp. NPDC002564 TaxID=3364649 RepID=UPI00369B8581
MMYDRERSQQPPQARNPNLAEQHASQDPRHESARPPLQEPRPGLPMRAPGALLVPQGEREKLALRLQQALNSFVENPLRAVEEADGVLAEAIAQLTAALTERHHGLRDGRPNKDAKDRTEELRIALQQYKETTERVLRL